MWRSPPTRRVSIFVSEVDVVAVTEALLDCDSFRPVAGDEYDTSFGTAAERGNRWSELADTYEDLERRLTQLLAILHISTESAPVPAQIAPRQDAYDIVEILRTAEREVMTWKKENDYSGSGVGECQGQTP